MKHTSTIKANKENLNKKQFCIVSEYYKVVALGVNGSVTVNKIILKNESSGFETRDEAKLAINKLSLCNQNIKGKENEGYGSLGKTIQTVKVYTINHALKKYTDYELHKIIE